MAPFLSSILHPRFLARTASYKEIMVNQLEILVVSNTPGLNEALQGYDGLLVSQFPSLARVRSHAMWSSSTVPH